MNTVNLIIFSKDRAMQLEALVHSLQKNALPITGLVTVLYKTTTNKFQDGYDRLISQYPLIEFVKEELFERDIKDIVHYPGEYLMFLVDDDMCYQPLTLAPINHFLNNSEYCCFSYRLGLNTNYCYTINTPMDLASYETQMIPNEDRVLVSWDWRKQIADYGYPLSLSSHVFKRDLVVDIVKDISFNCPNRFEENLQQKVGVIAPKMASYEHSAIVNIPVNRVNDEFLSRNGERFSYTVDDLNNLFLSGKVIDIDNMNFAGISSPHQEIKYEFKEI